MGASQTDRPQRGNNHNESHSKQFKSHSCSVTRTATCARRGQTFAMEVSGARVAVASPTPSILISLLPLTLTPPRIRPFHTGLRDRQCKDAGARAARRSIHPGRDAGIKRSRRAYRTDSCRPPRSPIAFAHARRKSPTSVSRNASPVPERGSTTRRRGVRQCVWTATSTRWP